MTNEKLRWYNINLITFGQKTRQLESIIRVWALQMPYQPGEQYREQKRRN